MGVFRADGLRGMCWGVLVSMVVGCMPSREIDPPTTDSQAAYSYAGCASGELVCPQDVTLLCAVFDIQSRYSRCQVDADCTLVTLPTACYGTGDCPPIAVASEHAAIFEQEATAEINAYCNAPHCEGSTTCELAPELVRAACVEGTCMSELEEVP